MSDEIVLLPCPFCGGAAEWSEGEQKTQYGNEQIYCSNCYAVTVPEPTKELAARWWNARGPNPQLNYVGAIESDLDKLRAAAASPAAPEMTEALDAVEGLLITFVYENPLPPDLAETTRDAHIAVAEELLLRCGRKAFVESRVDRPAAEPSAAVRRLVEASKVVVDEPYPSYEQCEELRAAIAAIEKEREK